MYPGSPSPFITYICMNIHLPPLYVDDIMSKERLGS